MKNCQEFNWKPYRKIDIRTVDPNNEIPKWDLIYKGENAIKTVVNPFDWSKQPGKRGAVESPEARNTKRNDINDWQICEFLWAFLEGTVTTPNYKNLDWEKEAEDNPEESSGVEEEAVEEVAEEILGSLTGEVSSK